MCTNDFENNAIDFLLYSYFNFDTSTSPEEMFDLMIKKGMKMQLSKVHTTHSFKLTN